jgi:hypothetical protein
MESNDEERDGDGDGDGDGNGDMRAGVVAVYMKR